jgi:hypothetical protein
MVVLSWQKNMRYVRAVRAIELLNSLDPVNNVAWKDEIAERNQRVANELVTAVSNLENITVSSSSSEQQ